ncbi:MAG: hypothetical protein ACHQRM_17325 [Bacteroidia bacterium]
MELHLKIAGYLLICLSLLHLSFPRYFKWKTDLAAISLMNRQLMYVHTLFIAFTTLLMGLLCVYRTEDLRQTALGREIALGFFLFWLLRLVIQFVGYSPRLWKGKAFETIVHIVFSLLWIYFCTVFFFTWYVENTE